MGWGIPRSWRHAAAALALCGVLAYSGLFPGHIVSQLVTSLVQIVFFVTPIMWLPEILAARGVVWVANTNPIYHFIEIVRAPLSGAGTPVMSWLAVVAVTVLGWMLALAVLYRFRHRVPYWL